MDLRSPNVNHDAAPQPATSDEVRSSCGVRLWRRSSLRRVPSNAAQVVREGNGFVREEPRVRLRRSLGLPEQPPRPRDPVAEELDRQEDEKRRRFVSWSVRFMDLINNS